ncbi:hypothetical protein BJG93_00585 [Paraburkholderia sprentiae WSM5005]|uniref:Uncharacterized protein n=1 Tax=Paraburkholderia sprentiae WSM5005 TaxID=754502 RepID=A0A1I9YCN0_9BURK|nr:hypothetical protein [Paraburkholderia sprentiae]APA84063.1 hypothetical protein BJG93_00585 [Paraburkholderia sprentiae WSM5005]
MQTMVHITSLTPIIRDYRGAIRTCQKEFNNVNNETTERGAAPGAFQGNQAGPAGKEPSAYRIFNDWADEILKRLIDLRRKGELVKTVDSQASFDEWHRGLVASLDEYWSANAHPAYPLSRKQLYKLVNLFVKWLRIKVADDVRAHIEKHGHTTLNTPTVRRVGELLGDSTLTPPADDKDFDNWYHDTQKRIRDFTETHGGSPIIVDVWCRAASLADPDEDG